MDVVGWVMLKNYNLIQLVDFPDFFIVKKYILKAFLFILKQIYLLTVIVHKDHNR